MDRGPKTPGNTFGARLAAVRLDSLGMNQEQLARALHASVGTVRGWEQGASLPAGENAWRLFHLLGAEAFASLMPHVQPDAPTIPVGENGHQATLITLTGSPTRKLARLVQIAEQIAREDSGAVTGIETSAD